MENKKKLLWVGDGACPSGFARSTHKVLETLSQHYDVTVLGINYRGDPHEFPYPIYTAVAGGDPFGVGRLVWMCDLVQPDLIVIQQDPWNFQFYLDALEQKTKNYDGHYAKIPVIGVVAVDGLNCSGKALNRLALGVFWTEFGLNEARLGGFDSPGEVIPLGVDLDVYHPMDKLEARERMQLPKELDDAYIVGNVNRNQPRKRWDLTVRYFARWVHESGVENAKLFLHASPTGEQGINVKLLAHYYNVLDRLILSEPQVFYGVEEALMPVVYNCFDVQVSTSQGEGFGLTTLEGMACRVAQVFGGWSALGDWGAPGGLVVPCTSTHVGPPYVNVVGGVPDEDLFVKSLKSVHERPSIREQLAEAGLKLAQQDRFRWEHIGERFLQAVQSVIRIAEEQTPA